MIVRQPDGKLLVGGSASSGSASSSFAFARYNPDGALDHSFGSGGKAVTSFGERAVPSGLLLQPDGKFVAAGLSFTGAFNALAIARYNGDGSLDASFGSAGRVITPLSYRALRTGTLVRQADGRLVLSARGSDQEGGGPSDLVVSRYNVDGSLDPGFGRRGRAVVNFRQRASGPVPAVVQPNGALIVGLTLDLRDGRLIRIGSRGALDRRFGRSGFSRFPGNVNDLVGGRDGKLIAGGRGCRPAGCEGFALARYRADGSPDRGFGFGGTRFGPEFPCSLDYEGQGEIAALALAPGGRLVAAGDTCRGFSSEGALARYYLFPLGLVGSTPQRLKTSTLTQKGLRIEGRCSERCRIVSLLLLDRRHARRLQLPQAIGGGRAAVASRGRTVVHVKLTSTAARRLRRVESVPVTLRTSFAGAPARPDVLVRRLRLER